MSAEAVFFVDWLQEVKSVPHFNPRTVSCNPALCMAGLEYFIVNGFHFASQPPVHINTQLSTVNKSTQAPQNQHRHARAAVNSRAVGSLTDNYSRRLNHHAASQTKRDSALSTLSCVRRQARTL